MYLIFDTETTGLPHNHNAPLEDSNNWPRLVQLAWQVHAHDGSLISNSNYIVKPDGYTIPFNAQKIHGISTQHAEEEGHDLNEILSKFSEDLLIVKTVVGHNVVFDLNIVGAEYLRSSRTNDLASVASVDTKLVSTDYVALPIGKGGKLKWPTLTELHYKLFCVAFDAAHDAAYDVHATAKCFFGLISKGVITSLDHTPKTAITYEAPALATSHFEVSTKQNTVGGNTPSATSIVGNYCHLHLHSQFSVLQATPKIKPLVAKAKALGMPAVGLTDLGNMYGGYHFVETSIQEGIKPILGQEFFISEDRRTTKFTKDNPDRMTRIVLLAKNKAGYHHLAKLSSLGHIEGLYGLYPRVDKELITKYKEHLICLTGGLQCEVPSLILNHGEEKAEKALLWWQQQFGEDLYMELNRHGLDEEHHVNEILQGFSKKHGIKLLASNHVHYLHKKDAKAHDVLLCIKDGKSINDKVGQGRTYRYALPNDQYYFKSQEEMKTLFVDIPEAITNIQLLIDSVEAYRLARKVLLPTFSIPAQFVATEDKKDGGKRGENRFLHHLTYEGAKRRYDTITPAIKERLDFELSTIEKSGYPGYFLIVQDLTTVSRAMGVSVGPGRGSAAGSAVAYCIGITNVDPIAYDLLFERFLNPDRISLPDIDIDFDDEGREKVLKYVIDKYGQRQVAQIITYGTMAAKSSIRDAGRVMDLPLPETDAIAKLIPERVGISLEKALKEVKDLRDMESGNGLKSEVIQQAKVLEGSVRNIGIHACGVIITPSDITQHLPVGVSKDADLLVTQFDNSVVEDAGMLKMDFLGLKTLSIIKTACANIKKRTGVEIVPDDIPLDDNATYLLYQRGETNGTFQFESPGMQKHLRGLKPDRFENLIALNALYRPGPMEYIPNFIARKKGQEKITYDLKGMETYLAETYGITVYQEQVMRLSQLLAGFTKGEADMLRKAMGKKVVALLNTLKPKFISGCAARGHDEKMVQKVWKDWEAFASYAFNKSHSTCYSVVAYHTAYLKAHYPAEYMAAVLTHNQDNIEKVSFFMEECRVRGIKVLGPDVNESDVYFQVNQEGQIRFGMRAIKGAGAAAAESIIAEREANGKFKDFFDFVTRIDLRAVNKKTLEALAQSGGFDLFEVYHRRQYLMNDDGEASLIEKAIKYAHKLEVEAASAQVSLFGGDSGEAITPTVSAVKEFSELEKLRIEKEVVGLYISGHPLDQFQLEIDQFCNTPIEALNGDIKNLQAKSSIKIGGQVTTVAHRMTKNGKPFGTLTLEDFSDSFTFFLFSDEYVKFKEYLETGWFLYIQCSVQMRWKSEDLELKIKSIELLDDIRATKAKGISINVNLKNINKQFIQKMKTLMDQYVGNSLLKLTVYDDVEHTKVNLLSRKVKVNPKNELLKRLDEMDEVTYKVMV